VGRRLRATGWGLLALAVAVPAVIVAVGAFRAHTDAAFNRWGVWATVTAVPIAALGIVLMLTDKIRNPAGDRDVSTAEAADQLAAVVLGQVQAERSRLIFVDHALLDRYGFADAGSLVERVVFFTPPDDRGWVRLIPVQRRAYYGDGSAAAGWLHPADAVTDDQDCPRGSAEPYNACHGAAIPAGDLPAAS
jgi:hypothetical protein